MTNLKRISLLLIFSILSFYTSAQEKEIVHEKILEQFKYQTLIYKTVNGENLEMIIFMPKVKKYAKTPVMLYTHGGGWKQGDRFNVLRPNYLETLKILNDNGIACASVEYRLLRPGISNIVDCLVDCKDAGRFLVKNAALYQLDPSKVGAWGGSAGGQLSLMTALGNPKDFPGEPALSGFDPVYKCVASYFPATSFLNPDLTLKANSGTYEKLFGDLPANYKNMPRLLSPVEYLKKNTLPILLLHGDEDRLVSVKHSLYMVEAAKKVGAPVQMITVKGGGHNFKGDNIQPNMSQINAASAKFIMTHLLK